MKKIFLLLLIISISYSSYGQTYNKKYGVPIIGLVEQDSTLIIQGSEVPSFAVYGEGQIIYRKKIGDQWAYFEVQKEKDEIYDYIIYSLGFSKALLDMEECTTISSNTDSLATILFLNIDPPKHICVFGDLKADLEARRQATPSFLKVYDNIIHFDDPSATQWLPDEFEVMAIRAEYIPPIYDEEWEDSDYSPVILNWNKEWNDLKSETTIKHADNFYSIFLDKKHFNDFLDLVKTMGEEGLMNINGVDFYLFYRLPFPNIG